MIGIEELYHLFVKSSGICTDTRKIKDNVLFFALRGDNFNGNDFVEDAFLSGAQFAIVDDPKAAKISNTYLVDDVLNTLQQLAVHHRKQFDIPIIGITGTNGKTTTKELIAAVLSTGLKTHATEGNFNNHLGVPLTILMMPSDTEIAVIEMGANHLGEIAALCAITAPTHGLITNIGRAHLEGFGDFEGVLRAKSELYDYLLHNQGIPFINSRNSVFENMAKRFSNKVTYPCHADNFTCSLVEADPFVKFESQSGVITETQLIGDYNFQNIAAALCIADHFDIPEEKAIEAIRNYVPANNRSQILKTSKNSIILDAYNANPESMKAALSAFDRMKSGNKVVILGDMLELGSEAVVEHKKLGREAAKLSLESVIFVGPASEVAATACGQSVYFSNKDELKVYLEENPIDRATILIKASRGMGLETLVDLL